MKENKYKIMWWEPGERKEWRTRQEIVVYGEDAACHVVKTIAPKDTTVDVIPIL